MSLRTWLATRFRPRNAGNVPPPYPNWFALHPWLKEAGVLVTAETAAQVSAVYGCCRLIVDCIAPAHIDVTEIQPKGVKESRPDDPVAYTLNYGAPLAAAPDAPTMQAIKESLFWAALLHGNGYAEIQRDGAGNFFALWPIQSERVTPWRDDTGFYYRISQPTNGGAVGGGWQRLEPKDMFHLHGPSLYGWVGDSPVYRAAKAIGIAQAAQVYSAAYFANGTVIAGLLSSEKMVSKDQADRAKAEWIERIGIGPDKSHGLAVLGQGFKYQPVNHNAQEAQLIDARRFQVHEIARFYGVPTTLLADNEAWTNLGELYLGFYRNALRPWARRFDLEATRKLFPQRKPWRVAHHDLTHLTMGSFKDQVGAVKELVSAGIWTRNEARDTFGKNHVGKEGDVLTLEGKNVQTLEHVLEEPEPVAPQLPAKTQPGKMPMPPGKMDPEEEAEPEEKGNVSARDAVVAMFSDAFARHAKRIKDDRPRSPEGLAKDCAAALALASKAAGRELGSVDLAGFADALEQGEPPDKAAARFVDGLWRDAA